MVIDMPSIARLDYAVKGYMGPYPQKKPHISAVLSLITYLLLFMRRSNKILHISNL